MVEAVDAVRSKAQEARGQLGDSAGELAQAIRGNQVAGPTVEAAFARHEEAFKGVKQVALTQLQRVTEALDERQRALLADLLEHLGSRRFGPHFT
jgi:hypothetical protein